METRGFREWLQVLEEMTTLGTPTMSYFIGDDVLGQCAASPGTPRWLFYDGHGSTRQLVSGATDVQDQYHYDSYGQSLTTLGSSPATSLLYSGEQYDSALQMYNLRARYYNPSNGRFNERDTFSGTKWHPQSLHKYAYANSSDPVNGNDPSGLTDMVQLVSVISITTVVAALATTAVAGVNAYYALSSGDPGFALTASFRIGAQAVGIVEFGVDVVYFPKTDELYGYYGFDSGFTASVQTAKGTPLAFSGTFGPIVGIDEPDEWSGNSVTATLPVGAILASRLVLPWLNTRKGTSGLKTLLEKLRHMDKNGSKFDFMQVGVSTSGPAFLRIGPRSNTLAWEAGWLSDPYLISDNVASSLKQIFNKATADSIVKNPEEAYNYAERLENGFAAEVGSLAERFSGNADF